MRTTTTLAISLFSFLALGCDEPPPAAAPSPESARESESPRPEESEPASPADPAHAAALTRANAAADDLGRSLRGRLLSAMSQGGVLNAVSVCAGEAPSIAASVAARHDAVVGRSSLRRRSPANAPPPWVEAWLRAQGERPAAEATGFARIEDGRARVLRPIAIEGACTSCHGPADSLAPDVAAALRERYPSDAATGYREGDLRGALYADVSVTP